MTSFRAVIVGASLVAFGALGCAPAVDQALMFKETQRRYTQLIRFTDYERAGRFVAPDVRSEFRDQTRALGDLHFTDYELRDVQNSGSTAIAEVAYVGYRSSDPVVVTYVEHQEWENDGGTWLVRPHIEAQAR